MDDFFDDFDNDFDDGSDENGDKGECDDNINDFETDDDITFETTDGSWDGPEWQDWMIIGPLSEELSRERREKDRIQRENDNSDDDYGTLPIDDEF